MQSKLTSDIIQALNGRKSTYVAANFRELQ